jgi:hypothetical protein
MGKVLIEKLLYSCLDVKEIIILMREKRGMSGKERVENFKKLPVSEFVVFCARTPNCRNFRRYSNAS